MDWTEITSTDQVKKAIDGPSDKPVLLFKHSTRCSISSTAKHRIDRIFAMLSPVIDLYLINVIQNRDVSNAVAANYSIQHESPQALLFHNGRCIYNASHLSIDAASLIEAIENQS